MHPVHSTMGTRQALTTDQTGHFLSVPILLVGAVADHEHSDVSVPMANKLAIY
ncbi:hypothetical protein T11_16735 [Trichinella zimbabwensis]|uniref:Uncharacterized protein n=1 Tax=Trichinella zimbabwensis TaxID=268475 RepID=A0A0V1I0P8_9BILA|nr:hypothetical protein T11_16735 [Trichinella zimbabwensis]